MPTGTGNPLVPVCTGTGNSKILNFICQKIKYLFVVYAFVEYPLWICCGTAHKSLHIDPAIRALHDWQQTVTRLGGSGRNRLRRVPTAGLMAMHAEWKRSIDGERRWLMDRREKRKRGIGERRWLMNRREKRDRREKRQRGIGESGERQRGGWDRVKEKRALRHGSCEREEKRIAKGSVVASNCAFMLYEGYNWKYRNTYFKIEFFRLFLIQIV